MHVLKNKIVLALLVSVFAFMAGCAGSSGGSSQESPETAAARDAKVKAQEADKLAMLESMFTVFKESVKNRAPSDILLDFLTDPSEAWLDELESHAKSYDAAAMDTCQFYEAYAIVLYRLFEREHLWDVTDYRMLYLLLYNSGFLDRMPKTLLPHQEESRKRQQAPAPNCRRSVSKQIQSFPLNQPHKNQRFPARQR